MFRRFFRIGFGGCGCALEEHFRDHAAELSHGLLNDFYLKKLENWTNKLPSVPFETTKVGDIKNLIIPPPKEGEEGGDYAGKFFGNLNNIIAELDSWKGSLGGAKDTVMSYEGAIIDELIQNVRKMKDEAKSIKNRGSVLLQSLPVDSFTKIEAEKYKRFYTYNQNITETRELIVDQFGHAVIESQGFNHQPELQMLPFSIKEVRDEVFKKIREYITNEKLSTLTSQGYFFYVGLGGGTGTGVISPLAEKFGKGSYGYFALAVLGAEEDNDRMKSQQPWFRRCFNMLIALNDLIVTAELDGLILVDNARLIQKVDEEELKLVFCWEEVPGNKDEEKNLISFLQDDLKLEWVKNATISKETDGNTITISKTEGEYSAKIVISDEDMTKANVISAEKTEEVLTVRIVDGKQNIYAGKLKKASPLMTDVDEKLIKALYPAFGITTLENGDYDLDWSQLRKPIGLHGLKNKPPLIVPCYASGPCSSAGDNLEVLIDAALDKGILAPCKYKKDKVLIPEKVFVYVRCIKDEGKLREKLAERFAYFFSIDAKFESDLKNNDISEELYGIFKTKFSIPQSEYKTPDVTEDKKDKWLITAGNKVYIAKNEDKKLNIYASDEIAIIKDYLFCWDDVVKGKDYKELESFLKNFYDRNFNLKDYTRKKEFDEEKLINELIFCKNGSDNCVKLQIKKKENERNEVTITFEGTPIEKDLLEVKKKGEKRCLYLKSCDYSINWVKKNLEKRIVVFESQEIGSFWHEREKKNEVLILLVNPDVKDALKERFEEAKKFVDLLVTFTDLLEASTEDKLTTANQIVDAGGDIEKVSLKRDDKELVKKWNLLEKQLNKISNVGIDEKTEKDKDKKKLKEARDFLLPEELYGKGTNIYEYMKGVLERLGEQAKFLDGYIDGTRKWPIFKEKGNIFNIISTSGKRDEVILSAIEALEDQNKFNRLVGEGVYDTYFETFRRQYFKYNARYLYSEVGEHILSDAAEKELPVALKEELDKEEERITGEDLRNLMKKYTRVMDGHTGTTDGTKLSYPAMLAVAGLYAEWEQVGSWNYDETKNGFVLAENKDKIIEKLFKKENPPRPDDFEDYVFSKESQGIIIPDKRNLLIIDTDKEDATLVIREADKDLLTELTKEDVPSTNEIPKELVERFKGVGSELVNNDNYSVKDRKLLQPRPEAITKKKLYCCYYIKENAGKYNIDGDKINNNLKVKKEEGEDGKTLKIYQKRRGEREV